MIKFENEIDSILKKEIEEAIIADPTATWNGIKLCPDTFQYYYSVNDKNYRITLPQELLKTIK